MLLNPLQDKEFRKAYGQRYIKKFDKQFDQFTRIVRLYLNRQKDRVVSNLDNQVKSLEDEVFNMQLEIDLAKKELLPFLQDALIQAGAGAMLFQGSDWEFNFTAQLASTLDKRADLFSKSINETTFKKLKSEFLESAKEGENRKQLIKRIENTYDDQKKWRAPQIARTEVQVANQTGINAGYKQAGATIKIWVWAAGVQGGVRDDHLAIDGEEVPIDSPFSNGLMFPGDPTAGAGEVINCLCTH